MLGKRSVDSSELVNNTAALVAFAVEVEVRASEHSLGLMDESKSVASSLLLDAAS